MFLERFLIGNLWNAGLIFLMFGLKRLMQNRVSLRFQYYSWYVLIVSLLLPLFPSSIWNVWSFSAQNSLQTMATYNLSVNTVDMTHATQWTEDTTQLMMENTQKLYFEFGVLNTSEIRLPTKAISTFRRHKQGFQYKGSL